MLNALKGFPSRPTPLLVISLFVFLVDAVATLGLVYTEGTVQIVLTAFVVGFPSLVASAFFVTLWVKPYVLYSPEQFHSMDVERFVQAMKGMRGVQLVEEQTEIEKHIAIFLIKAQVGDGGVGCSKVLTSMSPLWKCHLLANCHYDPGRHIDGQLPELKSKLSQAIPVAADDISISRPSFESGFVFPKYSYTDKCPARYSFEFFFVSIGEVEKTPMLSGQFSWQDKDFKWMSISELKADEKTIERNFDIVKALDVTFDELQKVPSSFDEVVRASSP